MSVFQTGTILFTISIIIVSFLAVTLVWYGLVYWLKKRAEAKRRLKSEKAKEKARSQLQPASYRRKISAGNRSLDKYKTFSSSSSKLNVPDSKVTAKVGEVAADSAPEEACLVEGNDLNEHLRTDENPGNATGIQLEGDVGMSNQVAPSLSTALLIVASRLTNTASLKLMTEMMLSEIIHGDSWSSEDIELARQHLVTASMMTSQQHAELSAKVLDTVEGGKDEGSKEDSNEKSGDKSDNVKQKDKEEASFK